MVTTLLMSALILIPVLQTEGPAEKRFLQVVRILSARVVAGEVTLAQPDGETRTLSEGDVLDEEGGARLEEVSDATLVFRRVVNGAEGGSGEAVIVVHYDETGKTRVREFRSVPDTVPKASPRDSSSGPDGPDGAARPAR